MLCSHYSSTKKINEKQSLLISKTLSCHCNHSLSFQIKKHENNLLNYIIFLRVTPILPNWFINIASPVIDVPIWPFFMGTLLGVAPPSFLFIQAGTTLQMMTNANVVWSWSSIATLAFFAVLSIAPVFYKKLKVKDEWLMNALIFCVW